MADFRVGIDFGGTKIEIAAIANDGRILLRRRVPNPSEYAAAIAAIRDLVEGVESELNGTGTVGVGIPGAVSPDTGLVKNANSVWLNGRPFARDLSEAMSREVRVENDANCFALSEAVDGAGAGSRIVFGVILGTGVGGGIVVDERVLVGRHSIAGEWGHTPLPWIRQDEFPLPRCFCGNEGCIERYLCGSALAEDCDGPGSRDAHSIPERADAGEEKAIRALDRHAERLARALAMVVNFLDPDAIVLGGGLSNMKHLYIQVPKLLGRHVISPQFSTPILPNKHGDSSGVRGAAWLWPRDQPRIYRTSGS
ncbi:ROK family protein [Rhizosaccharibacter radicis]|uniref:ROK family protein n=1 Tax=Rhizosaccharibacter radicis TaxID=2782605 RepID=A0ABT1W167_9PROT|nr:ROK family protein [Acetobacteraceae bacterium KSS12]